MRLRKTVFDSKSERRAFTALIGRWSKIVDLYPQLPLAKIIELGPTELEAWPTSELRYFHATNIDYTLCDRTTGAPILSIEFDGIGGGYSRDGRYVAKRPTPDRRRQWKLDTKLRLARAVSYPLIVVSFEEVDTLSEEDETTILDGFIGRLLVSQALPGVVETLVEEARVDGDELDQETAQDIVLQAEVLTNMEHDPLAQRAMEAQWLGDTAGVSSHRIEYLTDPPAPDVPEFSAAPDILAARVRAFENAERMGCRVVVETPLGTIERVTWVRNIGTEWGISPTTVAQNISLLVAFRSAHALLTGEVPPLDP